MKRYLVVTVLTFLSLSTQTLSQVEVEVSDEANSTASPINEVLPTSLNVQHEVEVCNEHDNISKTYCKCDGGVVNCDFSKFSTQQANHTVELSFSGFAIPPTTRRVCFCNTPIDLGVTFTKTFLPNLNQIHRFDLYNLKGVSRLDGAFSANFNGDLYISNLTMIPEIHAFEFGRGDNDKFQNLQDMECCSPIKVNQNFKKPILFVENTAIGTIRSGGISDMHLWQTIILKSVNINLVEHNGINSNNPQTDIAIIDSIFTTIARWGIHFEETSNLFLAKTYFKLDSDHFAWSSKSKSKDSNVVLLGNTFWYPIIHEIDASRIVSLNNIYLTWDNYTFKDMGYSSFKERSISIKYNVISFVDNLVPQSFSFSNGSQVDLKENVLGSCNCSQYLLKDPFLKRDVNRCFAGNISDPSSGKCSLSLEAVVKACSKSSAPNFNEMCRDKSIATSSTLPGVGMDVMTGVEKAHVNSTFITTIVNEYPKLIGVNFIATTDGVLINSENPLQDDENSAHSGGSSDHQTRPTESGSAAITVIIILTVLVIVSVAVIIGYRNRHRFFGRNHQRLDSSREVFI